MYSISRPIQAEAYSQALADLAKEHPEAVKLPAVIDAVMAAVLDLTAAGQTDAVALARYAVDRGRRVYRESAHKSMAS